MDTSSINQTGRARYAEGPSDPNTSSQLPELAPINVREPSLGEQDAPMGPTDLMEDPVLELRDDVAPPCSFITGIAGSGKTHGVMQRAHENGKWGLVVSTTGVSAVNLGTITLNSALGYFDTASLEDKFLSGYLRATLHRLARQYRNLVIDEVSMMDARQLDVLHQAMSQANASADVNEPMGIVAVGDFMQLPAVNAPMAFEAECWPEFERNTTRLTKCWRQGEGQFLDALNQLRAGNGREAVPLLEPIVSFRREAIPDFDGTTIVATNRTADDYNWLRYKGLRGMNRSYHSKRWGKESGGWKLIPDVLNLKVGTLVMVLSNDSPAFTYVNGDLGHVVDLAELSVAVELTRNKSIVNIPFIERRTEQRPEPDGYDDDQLERAQVYGTMLPDGTYWRKESKRWVLGAVTYMPLRYGWASTTFKSQGLSLDKVQVDLRHHFMSSPGQVYVACSRVRTAQGLTLVGSKDMLVKRCNAEPKVLRWL